MSLSPLSKVQTLTKVHNKKIEKQLEFELLLTSFVKVSDFDKGSQKNQIEWI
jgi:hypothetical protein